jgi:hypothetical protein
MIDEEAMDRLKRQIYEATNRVQAWPLKDQDLTKLLPTEGVCTLCYLAGRTEQPKHDLILLCPHPSALLVPYRWSNGRLRAGPGYMADKSTFVDMVRALAEHYAGENLAATGRWMKLHGAAPALLEACAAAVLLLAGQKEDPSLSDIEHEKAVLTQLRDAIVEAGEQPP